MFICFGSHETGLSRLLHQVIPDAHLLELVQLDLDPVNVFLFVRKDRTKHLACPVVTHLSGELDVVVMDLERLY